MTQQQQGETRHRMPLVGLPTATPEAVVRGQWSSLWWVGCHGGAGTSTLTRLTQMGLDAGRAWPTPMPGGRWVNVVLVCRVSASGTWAATGAVEQYRARRVPGVHLLGLVAVAASPRRPPRLVSERLSLVGGWTPALWHVGWVDTFLAADDPADVGIPPDIQALQHAIYQASQMESTK